MQSDVLKYNNAERFVKKKKTESEALCWTYVITTFLYPKYVLCLKKKKSSDWFVLYEW